MRNSQKAQSSLRRHTPHYVPTQYNVTIIHPSIPYLSMCPVIPGTPNPLVMPVPSHLTIGSSQEPAIPYHTTKNVISTQQKMLEKDQQ